MRESSLGKAESCEVQSLVMLKNRISSMNGKKTHTAETGLRLGRSGPT